VLLAAGNADFAFDPPGFLDSFVYFGYFWHYPEHLWVFDDNSNYKISRLPWVLPGYALHTLAGPVAAAYVMAFLTIAGGAAGLYLLLRDSLHDRTAPGVVGVAWACCTWGHGIGGWSYHMMAAAAYYLMGCWLIVRAASRAHRGASAVTAGVFLASALHTNLFLVTFTPLVALLYWAALPASIDRPFARAGRAGLDVVCGGLIVTVALALVNRATGGAWLFFMPQIEAAWMLSQPDADIWWMGAAEWLPSALYLVIPVAFLVAGLAVPFSRRPDSGWRLRFALVALAWAALGIMGYFQFVRRQTALDYSYVAFALYLHAFPCVGAVLAGWTPRVHNRPALAVGLTTVVVLGALLFLLPTPLPGLMNTLERAAGLAEYPRIVGPLVVSLAGVGAMLLLGGTARLATFAVWFALVNAWVAPAPASYGLGTPGYHRQMLTMFREADRLTSDLDPTLIGIKYWLSDEQIATAHGVVRLRPVFDSFVATRAWFTNLLGRVAPSPPIDQLTIADLDRGVCIGVLSSVERQAVLRQEMEARFEALGRPLGQVAERRFESPDLSFALTVLKPRPSGAGAGSHPPCAQPDVTTSARLGSR
jgi:hypothetical protein